LDSYVFEAEIALQLGKFKFIGYGVFPHPATTQKWEDFAQDVFCSIVKAWPREVPFDLTKISLQMKRTPCNPMYCQLLGQKGKVVPPGDPRWFTWEMIPINAKVVKEVTNG
jgi:hypothetical protein